MAKCLMKCLVDKTSFSLGLSTCSLQLCKVAILFAHFLCAVVSRLVSDQRKGVDGSSDAKEN